MFAPVEDYNTIKDMKNMILKAVKELQFVEELKYIIKDLNSEDFNAIRTTICINGTYKVNNYTCKIYKTVEITSVGTNCTRYHLADVIKQVSTELYDGCAYIDKYYKNGVNLDKLRVNIHYHKCYAWDDRNYRVAMLDYNDDGNFSYWKVAPTTYNTITSVTVKHRQY